MTRRDHPHRPWSLRRRLPRLPAAGTLHHAAARAAALRLHEHDALLRAARRHAETRHSRPSTGSTGPWSNAPSPGLPAATDALRYRGTAKNDHWLHHRAAALNLRRLITLGLAHNGTAWAITA